MTKQDFMEKLRLALNGKVTSRQLMENLDYYEEYINTEIRKGKSEEDVLAGLGDPRLIARTIAATGGGSGGHAMDEDAAGHAEAWYGPGAEEYRAQKPMRRGRFPLTVRVPLWAWLILALLVVVLVLSAVFSVIAALLPVLLPIVVVLFLVKVFRDWLN